MIEHAAEQLADIRREALQQDVQAGVAPPGAAAAAGLPPAPEVLKAEYSSAFVARRLLVFAGLLLGCVPGLRQLLCGDSPDTS